MEKDVLGEFCDIYTQIANIRLNGLIEYYKDVREKGYSNVKIGSLIQSLEMVKNTLEKDYLKLENTRLKALNEEKE